MYRMPPTTDHRSLADAVPPCVGVIMPCVQRPQWTDGARGSRVAWGVTAFVVFLALRAWGLDFGDPPRMLHPDERYAVMAERMTIGNLDPQSFLNPPLMAYMLFAVKQVHAAVTGAEASRTWIDAGGLILAGRWISIVLGALTAFVVGAAARRLAGPAAGRAVGVVATVIVGLSFLHGRDSHYGVNDVTMVFFVALSLMWSAQALQDGCRRSLLLAALAAGLATSAKYNGAIAAALPVAVVLLQQRSGAGRAVRASLGLLALTTLAFLATTPHALLSFEVFRNDVMRQVDWGSHPALAQSEAPLLVQYARASLSMLGWAHLAAAIVGWPMLLRRHPRAAVMLAVFPVAYLAGMLTKPLFFWRFALPLLPFAAVSAAWAWVSVARALARDERDAPRSRRGHRVAVALVLLASLEPAARLVRHDQLLTRDHTWIQAVDWIEANVPAGDTIFVEGIHPRCRIPETWRVVNIGDRRLDRFVDVDAQGVQQLVVEQGCWLVLDTFLEHERSVDHNGHRRYAVDPIVFHEQVRSRFQVAAEFRPGPNGDPAPFVLETRYSPITDLWSIERPGHTVFLVRIEPGTWSARMGSG